MRKYDIINALGRRHGLREYLEICTPTTGNTFARVDQSWFTTRHRLAYNCPDGVNDGLEYTYRTKLPFSYELVRTIERASDGLRSYDLIFVDPFHTLHSSLTDIEGAWNLLRPNGFIVVHDCNPVDESLTKATQQPGDWCGLTFRAFIDFVISRTDLSYCTVDTDFGCGVIRKRSPSEPRHEEDMEFLRLNWIIAREDEQTRYAFFDAHRRSLLQLTSVEDFARSEGFDAVST